MDIASILRTHQRNSILPYVRWSGAVNEWESLETRDMRWRILAAKSEPVARENREEADDGEKRGKIVLACEATATGVSTQIV